MVHPIVSNLKIHGSHVYSPDSTSEGFFLLLHQGSVLFLKWSYIVNISGFASQETKSKISRGYLDNHLKCNH